MSTHASRSAPTPHAVHPRTHRCAGSYRCAATALRALCSPRRAATAAVHCAWLQFNTNWLIGEPCINEWHGVLCCPRTHPKLSPDGSACMAFDAADGAAAADGETLSVLNSADLTTRRRLQTGDDCVSGTCQRPRSCALVEAGTSTLTSTAARQRVLQRVLLTSRG